MRSDRVSTEVWAVRYRRDRASFEEALGETLNIWPARDSRVEASADIWAFRYAWVAASCDWGPRRLEYLSGQRFEAVAFP